MEPFRTLLKLLKVILSPGCKMALRKLSISKRFWTFLGTCPVYFYNIYMLFLTINKKMISPTLRKDLIGCHILSATWLERNQKSSEYVIVHSATLPQILSHPSSSMCPLRNHTGIWYTSKYTKCFSYKKYLDKSVGHLIYHF